MNDADKTKTIINSISPSFCAAKWYNATVWLSNGRTASCHHPIAHNVSKQEVETNPSALHNTEHKKQMRKLMLEGERPAECSYCWRVEDNGDKDIHSDRIYKSLIYTDKEIESLRNSDYNKDVDPKTLEISFDNLCNLSCTYCNQEFSSTWMNDIKIDGPYKDLNTPGGRTYTHTNSDLLAKNEENIFIKKFFEWYDDSLKDSLQELRVTGGEPSRSPHFWKFVEKIKNPKFAFAVNSNLIMDHDRLDKLIECSNKFNKFDLYTSCESYGRHAEFVRHGLDYDLWRSNLLRFSKEANYNSINIMMTISALSVWTIVEFMEDVVAMRKEVGSNIFFMSFNILRFPSFQSVNTIPKQHKEPIADAMDAFVNSNREFLLPFEINQIHRTSLYLRKVDKSYEDKDSIHEKTKDFSSFVKQYAMRRNLIISEHFPETFLQWYKEIQ